MSHAAVRNQLRPPGFLRGVSPRSAQTPPFLAEEEEAEAEAALSVPAPAPAPPAEPVAPPPAPPAPPDPPAELIARYEAAIAALRQQGDWLAAQARSDALEIGFQVARRVLERELATSPEPLFALIRSAIRRAGESRSLTLRLHPTDLAAVEAAGTQAGLSVAQLRLEPDSSLQRGDCVVDTGVAQVDGRLSTRLAELRRSAEQALLEEEG
ncbi:FliH/SctL family protein [Vulgatibacter sp.]|uniref:FliH/SctL family protein n=1 Tax=Vulgatibacter sp. TaxID=1971226 RepID=UPI00356B04EA